ncbi:MAG: WG repeat-containing protein [Betaproteobacteria bacterium]|nr:WG repeat-containing protein [Betaproteobacteria bacterium]
MNNGLDRGKKKCSLGLVALVLTGVIGGLCCGIPINAAEIPKNKAENIIPILVDKKWGCINIKGEIVIPPKFAGSSGINFVANGLAAVKVKEGEKWGFINLKGEMVVPPRFEDVKDFAPNGLAAVNENGRWGYINSKGKMVIPPKFEYFEQTPGFYFNAGDFTANGLARIKKDGKYGYINAKGKIVIKPRFDEAEDFDENGLALVGEGYERNYERGYINAKGKMLIPIRSENQDKLNFATNGLALIEKNGKWGFINTKGNMVIPARFESARDFETNGLARIVENGKLGYINSKGEIVISPKFDGWIGSFGTTGLAQFANNEKWGYINTKGKVVILPRFDNAKDFAINGLAAVNENGKWGYINTNGKIVIPAKFDDAYDFTANGLARIVEGSDEISVRYYTNSEGKIASHSERVRIRKTGFINAKGRIVIPPRFDDAEDFASNGLAKIMENEAYGFINIKGKIVIYPRFKDIGYFEPNGAARIRDENGKWGYINTKGEIIILIDEFDGHEVLKNRRGEIIWPYESVEKYAKYQNDFKPSFDCTKSYTAVEKTICTDEYLSQLDVMLAGFYSFLDKPYFKSHEKDQLAQRAWLKRRNACKDADCVQAAYETRIKEICANNGSLCSEDEQEIRLFRFPENEDEK